MKPSFFTCLVVLVLAAGPRAVAAEAELQPNTIHGVIRFANVNPEIVERLGPPGGEGMSSVSVQAYSDDPVLTASTSWVATDPLENSFDLTAQANAAGVVYHIYGYLSLNH